MIVPAALSTNSLVYFRCKWKGAPCAHSDFSKQVTDYGLCYTFNAGDVPLTTAMTGEDAIFMFCPVIVCLFLLFLMVFQMFLTQNMCVWNIIVLLLSL